MDVPTNLVQILASLGVVQALLLSLHFATLKSGRRDANLMISLTLLGVSLRVGKSIFNHYLDLEPWHRNIGIAGLLLSGPAIWLYGRLLVENKLSLSWRHLLHFLPFAVFLLLSGIIPNRSDTASYLSYGLILAHLFGYLAFSGWQNYSPLRRQKSSATSRWYRHLLMGMALLWLYYLLIFTGLAPSYIGGALVYAFLVYAFSYMLMKRHTLVLDKYAQTDISQEESQRLAERFDSLLDSEKWYLKPRFSLQEAATSLGTSQRNLSRAINEHHGRNFSEHLNIRRIEAAKTMLADKAFSREKIATIGYECGFSNTTTFNSMFKREVGVTPSAYRKGALAHSAEEQSQQS